jgi:hypothetical protein
MQIEVTAPCWVLCPRLSLLDPGARVQRLGRFGVLAGWRVSGLAGFVGFVELPWLLKARISLAQRPPTPVNARYSFFCEHLISALSYSHAVLYVPLSTQLQLVIILRTLFL